MVIECRAAVDDRPAQFDRTFDKTREINRLLTKLDPALRDARDIEQVVDDPDHMTDLPFQDLTRPDDSIASPFDCRRISSAKRIGANGFLARERESREIRPSACPRGASTPRPPASLGLAAVGHVFDGKQQQRRSCRSNDASRIQHQRAAAVASHVRSISRFVSGVPSVAAANSARRIEPSAHAPPPVSNSSRP